MYTCTLNVGTTKTDGVLRLYDVNQFVLMKKEVPTQLNEQTTSADSLELLSSTSTNSISKNIEKVNPAQGKTSKNVKYALPETDSRGKKLTAEQRKFFNDSKVVDEQGRLLEVYHGTNDVETKETWNVSRRSFDTEYTPFTVFKKKWDGQTGHFFGRDIDNAGGYGSRVYKCYLNIKNL